MAPRQDERFHRERNSQSRTEPQRDRDRILYTTAFRRLARVTQVVSEEGDALVFHNRLTHSLKVAQCARRIAERLNRGVLEGLGEEDKLDPDRVEAAAIGHDLGHPPFGHTGERTLDDLAVAAGGFEGNAQSFRIVTKLAFRALENPGINLTRGTLSGLLKYPWAKGEQPPGQPDDKWGAYESERPELEFALDSSARTWQMTAQIMDWADDVTYAIHDFEDFYRAGLIPVDRLVNDSLEADRFLASFFEDGKLRSKFNKFDEPQLQSAFGRVLDFLAVGLNRPFEGSRHDRSILSRATAYFLEDYLNAYRVTTSDALLQFDVDRDAMAQVAILKELTWFYVINRPSLALGREGQKSVITEIHGFLIDSARTRSGWSVFPTRVREEIGEGPGDSKATDDEATRLRIVTDYIAGMTESQTYEFARRLRGNEPESALKRIV